MAPGYKSPFDHPPPLTPNDDHRLPETMLPFLAIILCVSLIVCLVLFSIRAAAGHASGSGQRRSSEDDKLVLPPDMALDQAAIADHLAISRGRRDVIKAMNIRDLFVRDEGCGVESGSVQKPLLSGKGHTGGGPLEQSTCVVEMAARENDTHEKGSISWHGTNTLNTSWGWMA